MNDDGIDPKVAAAVARPSPRRKKPRTSDETVVRQRITEDDPQWRPKTRGNTARSPEDMENDLPHRLRTPGRTIPHWYDYLYGRVNEGRGYR